MAKKRKITEVYAAYDWRGNMLTATVRHTRDEAEAVLLKLNPPVKGFEYPYKILPVDLDQDQNFQHKFLFDEDD